MCWGGYTSQEVLEADYEGDKGITVHKAYNADRTEHYTLIEDGNDDTVGIVAPGQTSVSWYNSSVQKLMHDMVPERYTLDTKTSAPSDQETATLP